jgi:cytochrome c
MRLSCRYSNDLNKAILRKMAKFEFTFLQSMCTVLPFIKKCLFYIQCLFFCSHFLSGCDTPEQEVVHKKADYIKKIEGKSESIPEKIVILGEVKIAYSDCYSCHTKEKRSKGPAFSDIAKRYPVNKVFIEALAQRVITGGYGSWGRAVMTPHPQLSLEDAKTMVSFILSLKKN